VTDAEVIEGFQLLSKTEGIIPALECAHVVAWITREAPNMQGKTVLMKHLARIELCGIPNVNGRELHQPDGSFRDRRYYPKYQPNQLDGF